MPRTTIADLLAHSCIAFFAAPPPPPGRAGGGLLLAGSTTAFVQANPGSDPGLYFPGTHTRTPPNQPAVSWILDPVCCGSWILHVLDSGLTPDSTSQVRTHATHPPCLLLSTVSVLHCYTSNSESDKSYQ